jgi:AGCS family alanine or glycine:cation symporter
VREGIVAGLEPLIDTLVVCTFSALIILATGVWNRAPDVRFDSIPAVTQTTTGWQFEQSIAPQGIEWQDGEAVTLIVEGNDNAISGNSRHRLDGNVRLVNGIHVIDWDLFTGPQKPETTSDGFYKSYVGATLTAKAFDSVQPGLGKWLITIAAWLFGFSTIITWAYYGEQGVIYLAGDKGVLPFQIFFCLLVVLATLGHIQTDTDLDNVTGIGLGVMVWANIPITLIFGYQAMRAYKEYVRRLKSGKMELHSTGPSLDELLGPARNE